MTTVRRSPRTRLNIGMAAVATTALLSWASVCGAHVYAEDFDHPACNGNTTCEANGWQMGNYPQFGDTWTIAPSGGVGGSAYLWGNRSYYSPIPEPISGVAAANALGDLAALYGQVISFSYYGRFFLSTGGQPEGGQPVTHMFYGSDANGQNLTAWWKPAGLADYLPFQRDWTQVQFVIDTSWNDGEANANGWYRLGNGTLSWAEVMHNIAYSEFFYAWQTPGSDQYAAGFDSVRITSVPEPGTLVLLGLGLAGLATRRRVR